MERINMKITGLKPDGKPIALIGGRLIDGTGREPLDDSVVLVEGTNITAAGAKSQVRIPEDSHIIDVSGKTVLPGFMDLHVHLAEDLDVSYMMKSQVVWGFRAFELARRNLMAGITTIRDVGGPNYVPVYLRDAIESGMLEGPRILACGASLNSSGHGNDRFAPGVKLPAAEDFIVDGVEDLQKAVRRRHKMKVDWIKFYATGGENHPYEQDYTDEEMKAIVTEAHNRRIRVCAHASRSGGTLAAIKAGVDTVEHGYRMTEEIAQEMVARGTWLVPTIFDPFGILQACLASGDPLTPAEESLKNWKVEGMQKWLEERLEAVRLAWQAGVKIAMGTDTGWGPIAHGKNLTQLELMVRVGMSPMESIIASTRDAAEALGLGEKLGTVEADKWADVVVVDGDPLKNIGVLAVQKQIALVMKNGCIYKDIIA